MSDAPQDIVLESPAGRHGWARWSGIPLWQRVFAGLALGVALGVLAPEAASAVGWLGTVFVRMIRMLVAPLVLVTIAAGVTTLGDPQRLGALGSRAIGLFAVSAAVAVVVGMAVGMVLQPGVGADLSHAVAQDLGAGKPISDQLIGIVPLNVFLALAEGDMLAIIFFALLLGVGVIVSGDRGEPVGRMLQRLSDVLLAIIQIVMEFAPVGVFGLIAVAVASGGAGVFVHVGKLALCVVVASAIQTLGVHGLLQIRILAGYSYRRFFAGARDPLLVAFSTASSAATLPVAMTAARSRLGLGAVVTGTVLPLGASIGRDGTALYVGLLAVFSAQALGIAPGFDAYLLVMITATLVALGTAPVPSASLFMLTAVLPMMGVSDAQTALLVGFILPFDRPLDMIRTIPNATTNLAVATIVARWEGQVTDVNLR